MRPPGLTTRASSRERRRRVVDVAQQVGEGEVVELAVGERQPLRLALDQLDPRARARARRASARRAPGEHRRALWSRPTTRAAVARDEASRDEPGAGRDVEDALVRAGVDRRDHRPPPARVLAEAERRRAAGRSGGESREQRQRAALSLTRQRLRWPISGQAFQKTALGGSAGARMFGATKLRERGEAMATEQQTKQQGDGAVATAGKNTLTVTDNRTGESYDLEITDGTIRGDGPAPDQGLRGRLRLDVLRPRVHEHGVLPLGDHLHRRRGRDPRSTAATRSSSSARSRPISRSPTCWSSASCPPSSSSSAGRSTSPTTPSSTRTSRTSSRPSATTPTRWGCCSPGSAPSPPSTRTPSTSTTPRSATWRRSA